MHNQTAKLSIKTAGSLVLSSMNLLLCAVALSLGYTGLAPYLGAIIIWLMCPPLFLFSIVYLIVDLFSPTTRKQAIVSVVLSAPIAFGGLALEISRNIDRGGLKKRIKHLNRAVRLPCRQILGIKNRGAHAFGGLQNQSIPEGNVVTYFNLQRLDNRFRRVDHDLPT